MDDSDKVGFRSNLDRWSEIVRPRGKGSVRRRWAADGDESRGGARRGLTGEGLGGALGLGLGRGFAGEVASGMRNPLVVLWR